MRAFRLAYDGTDYRGFQRQPHGNTVENELFDALRALGVDFVEGSPAGYAAAGRTDAGVSARAQTVAFEAPEWLAPRALNGELPAPVRVWASAAVPGSFHATHDAEARAYRYFLHRAGDDEAAETAAATLSGRHDFHNFTPDAEGTVRELSVSIRREDAFLVVDCRAGGFSRELVRRIVSALAAVSTGERSPEFLERALSSEPLSGPEGIAPAAPEPLVLVDVEYPAAEFAVDDRALASAREVFESRRRRRLAGARVAAELSADRPRR
ncbi:tRNA pseudouridine(38-40) synthase TruA [Natronomonas sp.]|uniref:tRNA pseudouridine(38-40) synthase TruA n=1 Tax=Natronomonas sp. TaxID=2184060 RepID=UPI0026275B86|nr:tRNA pseudouridine(38-40) synthase TruA [Natronomonas sp.]